ncbi:hypothetical protein APED_25515 [Acanthopleuribacter pedis]
MGLSNKAEVGYYRFDGNGGVTFTGFDVFPSPSYSNTRVYSKHINSAIRDLYPSSPLGHPLTQDCETGDMGNILIPSKSYASRTGTYTFDGSNLEIDIHPFKIRWTNAGDGWDTERWEIQNASSNIIILGVSSVKGFAYFSDGVGSYPINFDSHFDQGNTSNSASAYLGHIWSNQTGGQLSVFDPLTYKGEHKLVGAIYSNEDKNGQVVDANVYGSLWYYDLSNPSHYAMAISQNTDSSGNVNVQAIKDNGAFVQNTLYFNRYVAFPTLFFGTVGHIYHKAPKQGYESQIAYNSRRCWTDSDSIWTQGHLFMHLGAWNQNRISHVLSVEVSKNGAYPIISIGYGKGQFR